MSEMKDENEGDGDNNNNCCNFNNYLITVKKRSVVLLPLIPS